MELRMFISGKITGEEPKACEAKFEAIEKKLRNIGLQTIINPLKLGIPPRWKRQDITDAYRKVLKEQANSLVLLNNWENSFDSRVLRDLAQELKYEIFLEDDTDEIADYLRLHKPALGQGYGIRE